MRIHILAKCDDRFEMSIEDDAEKEVYSYDGHVPALIPNRYTDYVYLVIDAETGVITNWPKDALEQIKNLTTIDQ